MLDGLIEDVGREVKIGVELAGYGIGTMEGMDAMEDFDGVAKDAGIGRGIEGLDERKLVCFRVWALRICHFVLVLLGLGQT